MSDSLTLRGVRTMDRDRSHALFGQTMGYVAVTGRGVLNGSGSGFAVSRDRSS